MDNFDPPHIKLELPEAEILYYPNYFPQLEANEFYQSLLKSTPWQLDEIKVYGKIHTQPRLTALFGDGTKTLSYSNITMYPHLWNETLLEIKSRIRSICDSEFNTVLLNCYRNGSDSNGWHADNEKYLGKNPVIASVTFGQERYFHFKHNYAKISTQKLLLEHGSVLIMKGETQHYWKHQIPKTAKIVSPRINLTFRVVL